MLKIYIITILFNKQINIRPNAIKLDYTLLSKSFGGSL